MSEAWRIDSLDARAGQAFACWREADLGGENIVLDRQAIYLSPPHFSPEALSNRSTGFGASRGRAQLGVFIDEEELAFDTLEALTEFVRRVYVSAGGGDAGGGGGGGGRPRSPGPDGEPPVEDPGEWRSREGGEGSRVVLEVAGLAASLATLMKMETGRPVPTAELKVARTRDRDGRGDGGEALANGAAELLVEFLRRYPWKASSRARVRWMEGAYRLGMAVSELGLWPVVLSGPFESAFNEFGSAIGSKSGRGGRWPSDAYLVPMLFGVSPWDFWWAPDHVRERLFFMYRSYGYSMSAKSHGSNGDPLDNLGSWPLPRDVANLVGSAQTDATALNLVSAVSATPAKLAVLGNVPVRAAEILLFSVSHVLAESVSPSVGSWLENDAIRNSWAEMTMQSLDWLASQFPSLVFPTAVETLISDAAALRPT